LKRFRANETALKADARRIFQAALEAADAGNALRRHVRVTRNFLHVGAEKLDLQLFERVVVVVVGKAAVAMAAALEEILGPRIGRKVVVTKHGHAGPSRHVIEAGHPVPDEAGLGAARELDALLRELNARDLLLVGVSGGASALLPAPAGGVSLAAKQKTTNLLLRAGANIRQLNAVRKHLSYLKGGQLAALAYPATVVGLLLSDVVGDSLDVIGSGPTAPDSSTFRDAMNVLREFELVERVPQPVRRRLELGVAGKIAETPKADNPIFRNVHNVIIGSGRLALDAAALEARRLGYRPLILASSIEGETREVAAVHAQILRETVAWGNPLRPPACILSAGETTVTLKGHGKGGRNQEFALAAAFGIAGLPGVALLSGGTDGTDGPTDAAGAVADGSTIARAAALGFDAQQSLAQNDSYPFFDALGDLIRTGPTGTNVMDIHVLLAAKTEPRA
jgi:hydroxypyruvate reductase